MKKLLLVIGLIFISNQAHPCDTASYTDPEKFISDFKNGKCEKGYIYTVDYFLNDDNKTLSRHEIFSSKINSMTMEATIAITDSNGLSDHGYTTDDYKVVASLPKNNFVAYAICDFVTNDKTIAVWLDGDRDNNNYANYMMRLKLVGQGKGSLLYIRSFVLGKYGVKKELVQTIDDEGFHEININHVNVSSNH